MRFRFELSSDAQRQLSALPRGVQERIARAIDEMEGLDDSQWSNVKALQGPVLKGRFLKKVAVSDHFHKVSKRRRSGHFRYLNQIQRHI